MITIQEATVSSQGQVTIPAEIRRRLGLEKGSTLEFIVQDDGSVTLRVPKWTFDSVLGSVVLPREMSLDLDAEIEEAMEEAMAEKHGRAVRP